MPDAPARVCLLFGEVAAGKVRLEPRQIGRPAGCCLRCERAVEFFVELGLELRGMGPVEGRSVERVVGLEGIRAEVAMMQTPDGNGRLELAKFHSPSNQGDNRHAPATGSGTSAARRGLSWPRRSADGSGTPPTPTNQSDLTRVP
jgi:hypothetical protein